MKTINTVTFKLPKISQVDFKIECLEEHLEIRGNAIASGNDKEDKKIEDDLIEQLNNGNEWAWCTVKVTASYKGVSANDYLGGCSYTSEEDFKKDGYYKDMKQIAFDNLIEELNNLQD